MGTKNIYNKEILTELFQISGIAFDRKSTPQPVTHLKWISIVFQTGKQITIKCWQSS